MKKKFKPFDPLNFVPYWVIKEEKRKKKNKGRKK